MTKARKLIEEFLDSRPSTKARRINVEDQDDLKQWLEIKEKKHMPRPLYITRGLGGGQKYRIWWFIFDVLGNANKPTYFYTDVAEAAKHLERHGHISLQDWIDDPDPRLKMTPKGA